MGFVTLKDYIERHGVVECAYCGRKLSEIDVHWLGCCPLCSECHMILRGLK